MSDEPKFSLPAFQDKREPTMIERRLGRRVLIDPPNLHTWIKRFGGYSKITKEGWREYREALAD
jgi:hypothetical protein